MQVDPMKAVLKAPRSMLLKLRYDGPLSKFAFAASARAQAAMEAMAAAGVWGWHSSGGGGHEEA